MNGLVPLDYHRRVAGRLRQEAPESWAAFVSSGHGARSAHGDESGPLAPGQVAPGSGDAGAGDGVARAAHAELLRRSYRLDPDAHPALAEAVRRAGAALGVGGPVTVYQLEGSVDATANASLLDLPGELVIVFSGGLLNLLDDRELCAVVGHELAHRVLWTADGGDLLVADRLLAALGLDPATPPVHLETARRWNLATELFADRGALLACCDLHVAVSALVKAATGLAEVDAASFLVQAEAVDLGEDGSRGATHPETVLRARALSRWRRRPVPPLPAGQPGPAGQPADGDGVPAAPERDPGDDEVRVLLAPVLDLDRLDLLDREHLERITRVLIEAVLAVPWMRTAAVLAHARQFFPGLDLAPSDLTPSDLVPSDLVPSDLPPSGRGAGASSPRWSEATRRYLAYVLFDLATVDPDLDEQGLAAALSVATGDAAAEANGLAGELEAVARRERVHRAATIDRLVRAGGAG